MTKSNAFFAKLAKVPVLSEFLVDSPLDNRGILLEASEKSKHHQPIKVKYMKSTLTLAALICTAFSAHGAVLANFTGSTADTSALSPSATAKGVTTAANLNAGTTGGTWDAPTSTSTVNSAVLVSSGTKTGFTGNWLMMGNDNNDANHLSLATLNLTTAMTVSGTTITMDIYNTGAGGSAGGTLISGYNAGGVAIFQAVVGAGGVWGQRDLQTLTTAGSSSGMVGASVNGGGVVADNNIFNIAAAVDLSFNLGASGYTITGTGNGGSYIATGSYLGGTGDLAKLEFRSTGSKPNLGIDNISIVPEPSATLLGGLGCLFLLRRRRS